MRADSMERRIGLNRPPARGPHGDVVLEITGATICLWNGTGSDMPSNSIVLQVCESEASTICQAQPVILDLGMSRSPAPCQ